LGDLASEASIIQESSETAEQFVKKEPAPNL